MFFDVLQMTRVLLGSMLAYILSVTIAGAIKAWVAKRVGDETAYYGGFLTLDPLVHVDFMGLVVTLLTGFGWGCDVPVNMYNIHRPYRDGKILLVYYIQTVLHLLMTTLAILLLAGLEFAQVLYIGRTILGVTLQIVLQCLMSINIFLAMLRFIQSSMDLICMHLIERDPGAAIYIQIGSLVVTLVILLFIGREIQMFFANISTLLALFLLRLIA